jgi:tetratricopeptide (TPR) repeat protein
MSVMRCLLIAAVLCSNATGAQQSVPAAPEYYDDVIARALADVKQGLLVEAYGEAQKAIAMAPENFTGYYYAAFALYRRDVIDGAKPLADRALQLAPADKSADVKKLVEAIAAREQSIALLAPADEAFAAGLLAKAATGYENVWNLDRVANESAGLKAAELWSRLGESSKAMKIVRVLAAAGQDPGVRQKSSDLLATLLPQVKADYKRIFDHAVELLRGGSEDLAERSFREAAAVDESETEAFRYVARILATRGDEAAVRQSLLDLAKRGDTRVLALLQEKPFARLIATTAFRSFVGDAFGTTTAQELEKTAAIRDAIAESEPLIRIDRVTELLRDYPESTELRSARDAAAAELATQRENGRQMRLRVQEGAKAARLKARNAAFGAFAAAVPTSATTAERRHPRQIEQSVRRSCADCRVEFALRVARDGVMIGTVSEEMSLAEMQQIGVWELKDNEVVNGREYLPAGWYLTVKNATSLAHLFFDTQQQAEAARLALLHVREVESPPIANAHAEYESLVLFRYDRPTPTDERIYSDTFLSRRLSAVAADLTLRFPELRVPFGLDVVCRNQYGNIVVERHFDESAPQWEETVFTLVLRPNSGFAAGVYEVAVSTDGRHIATATFSVR